MGEFEKKIHGMFHTETLKSNNEVQAVFLEFCNSAKSGLLELVEEAKKEFPIKDSAFLLEVDARLIAQTGDVAGVQWKQQQVELLKWFVKWFGGSE